MSAFYQIAPLVGFSLNIVLAVLVLRNHLHSRPHQIFTVFLVSMGLWAFTIFGMRNSMTLEQALPWERAIFSTLPIISVSFFHFVLVFTRTTPKSWLIPLAYLTTFFFITLSATTGLIVNGMKTMWYGHGFVGGALFVPYIIIFYGFVIIALILLAKAGRKTVAIMEKTRYYYIAAGASLTLVGLLMDVLAARGVRIYPMGIPSNILFSAICTYSILKYQLLDIRVVVRKGTAYVLVSALGTGVYIGLLFIAYLFTTYTWSLPFWMNMAFILIIAVGLQPTLRWAQNLVDKWFYRGRYNYLNALEQLGEETKNNIDLAFIAGSLVDTVASAMRCKSVSVLLPDAEDRNFVSVAHRGNSSGNAIRIRRESALVWWLSERGDFLTRQDITITPQLQALTSNEKDMLNLVKAELFIPLLTLEGLRGILILGSKLSGQDYSGEEISMLRVVARQMATTLDNARLYDLQTKRYREQALLARLGMIVSSELDLQKICTLFLRELRKVIPIDYASITLKEKKEASSENLCTWTDISGLRTENISITSPSHASNQPYYLVDPSQTSDHIGDSKIRDAGMRSLLVLPLRSKEEILGQAVFAARKADAYPEDNLRLLQQVVIQLAIAIDKSKLYALEREARQELERQYQERTEFINSLIHEVKTPITAMLASSELLREELTADASTLGALAENLDEAAHNLDRRITELVNFVRLQSTETKLHLRSVDFTKIARNAVFQVTGLLRNKDQTLDVDLPPSLGRVKADPERLIQIMLNLLTNASKFSSPHAAISLRAHAAGAYLIAELHDNAPILKPEEREAIFSPYYQDRRKPSGGLGLGLSICKKLVELHSGKIWVESNGRGNIFKFSVPLASKERVATS